MFALHTGASGLGAYGEGMTVIGSNIANVNTLGYIATDDRAPPLVPIHE